MVAFIDFLNNREKASASWLAVILIYAFTHSGRALAVSLIALGRAALQWKLLTLAATVGAYSAGVVYLADRLGLWHRSSLKETIYWFVVTGLFLAGETVGSPEKPHLARRVMRRTLRFTVVLEFFVGLYVLPLWAEFVVVPIALAFVGMQAVVAADPSYNSQVRSFIDGVLGIVGLGLFGWALFSVANDVHRFFARANAERLLVPIGLSVALIPLLYLFGWYSGWELRRSRAHFL